MSIIIKEISSKKELKSFIRFPHELYKKCPNWVPSLDFDEMSTLSESSNPAFEFCQSKYWLAFKDNKIVGRIAGILNEKYSQVWGKKYARFGWFDFIDDYNVSESLLSTVENWAKENGWNGILGPMGFTDFDKQGLLIEGFNELGTITGLYNYPYYIKHLERLSYVKEVDWLEFEIKLSIEAQKKMLRIANIVQKRFKLKVLKLNSRKDILLYAKEIFQLINACYKNIFGFVALTDRQMDYYTKAYFSFLNPDYVQLIVDDNNKLAGFGLSTPSLSKALQKSNGKIFPFGFLHLLKAVKKNNTADLLLVAIREDMQGKGVNAIIMSEGYKAFEKNNISIVEASGQLETNDKVLSLWEHFDARQHKRKRCYKKILY